MNPEYVESDSPLDSTKKKIQEQAAKLAESGGKLVDKVNSKGNVLEKGKGHGLPYKTAKRIARKKVMSELGYVFGQLGKVEDGGLAPRKERRKLAKMNRNKFEPFYNGEEPKSYEEAYGVGYERFNNKFVTIK